MDFYFNWPWFIFIMANFESVLAWLKLYSKLARNAIGADAPPALKTKLASLFVTLAGSITIERSGI